MGLDEGLQKQLINEMLIESYEGLDRFDRYLLDLEQGSTDAETMNAIFRVIHTIKGTSGCLALNRIERVAHVGENMLQLMREGRLPSSHDRINALLSLSDTLRGMLGCLEQTGQEDETDHSELLTRLDRLTATDDESGRAAKARDDGPAQNVSWGLFDDAEEAASTPPPVPSVPVVPSPGGRPLAGTGATPAASAPNDPPTAAPAPARGASVAESAIRVDVGQLDKLMNLVGELVLARNQILQHTAAHRDEGLSAAAQHLNTITTELQERVMKTRMQPIGNVWSKFPRIVRDLAGDMGKKVRLVMDGNETELDRTIIEAIKDPLTHIVRNSIDHGVELPHEREAAGKPAEGLLLLHAFHEGGQVNIEIRDDGHGLDREKILDKAIARGIVDPAAAARMCDRDVYKLVFVPGFSTAEKVTNVSGRGVGMDVVRTNIEKIGGCVDVLSELGAGTTIKIKIPLTLAIIPALICTSGGERFAIPQVNLVELVRLSGEQARERLENVCGAPVFRLRGALLPLAFLNRELRLEGDDHADVVNVVVLHADGRPFGLIVDTVNDTEEIVVKPLDKRLKTLSLYAGATIMGDGKVALILDVLGLAQRAHVLSEQRDQGMATAEAVSDTAEDDRQTLLVLRVGESRRVALPLSSVARLEEFPGSAVERAGRRYVVQYRDQLLPLVVLEHFVPGGDPGAALENPLRVVVYADGARRVGLIVNRVEDIVHATIRVRRGSRAPGIMGSAVVQQRVTDLLDVDAILRLADAATDDHEPLLRAA